MKYVPVSEQTPHRKGDHFRVTVQIRAPYTRPMRELIETTFRLLAWTQPKLKLDGFSSGPPMSSPDVDPLSPWPLTISYEVLQDF